MSDLEALLFAQLAKAGLERPEKDWPFIGAYIYGSRRHVAQYAWPDRGVAVEIVEGPLYDEECHKALIERGFCVLVFLPRYLRNGEAIKSIKRELERGTDT